MTSDKILTAPSPFDSSSYRASSLRPRRLEIVEDESVWDARSFDDGEGWIKHLTPQHLAEIDQCINSLVRQGRTLETITHEDFEADNFARFMHEFTHRDVAKRGFGMIRGFPVADYSEAEVEMFFWGVGTFMGRCVSQNAAGDRLGHVRDHGPNGANVSCALPLSHCPPRSI